jgi:hypothetical protein
MLKNLKNLIIVFLSFISFGLIFSTPVCAYEIESLDVFDEDSFELGPTLFEITAKRGDSFTKELELTNRSGEEKTYTLTVLDFTGTKDPLTFTNISENPLEEYGASSWFTLEIEEITLSHGERISFGVDIDVPKNADAGEHYAVVLAETKEPNVVKKGGSTVKTYSRVGSLFLIDVEGTRVKSADLDDFFVDKNFYEKTPVNFNIDVFNNGTVHVKPEGKIEIYNIFNKKVDEITVDEFVVLRDSIRRKTVSWDKTLAFGKYRAELDLNIDGSLSSTGATVSFWVIPWKMILIALAIILILIFVLRFVFSKVKIEVRMK